MVELRYAASEKESGWLTREVSVSRRLLRRTDTTPKRLYFKLRGATLSAHPAETYPERWRSPIVEVIDADAEARRFTVKLEHATVTLSAETDNEYTRWHDALVNVAGASFERYYKRERYLARGHFSSVYLAVDRQTGEKFAVKIIKKDKNDVQKSKKFVRREVKVLSVTSHAHLVRAVDFFSSRGRPHIVMEYVDGGSLRTLIKRRGQLTQADARPIIHGILQGVAYMHENNIVHRDLKPDNVLMVSETFPKIADFGLATFRTDKHIHSVVGTPSYVAPEVMRSVPYGPPADVWATGIILYYMIVGERPYVGDSREEIKRAVLEGTLRFPVDVLGPSEVTLRHLITCLLTHDQRTRITAADALKHAWLAEQEDIAVGADEPGEL